MKQLNQASNAIGVFLSGGGSTRMGVPKQWLPFANAPLLLHTYDRLRAVCKDVVVLTNDTQDELRYRDFGLRTARDLYPNQGPLAGLHAGLQGLEAGDSAVLVGCDLPFLRVDILRDLLAELERNPELDAVVPFDGSTQIMTPSAAGPDKGSHRIGSAHRVGQVVGHFYPVCAVYRARVRDVAEDCLSQGENAMRRFLQKLNVLYIPTERWSAWTPDPFFNMNTPSDYELASTLWKREGFEQND